MGSLLFGRHFLKELDFTAVEWGSLLELAAELKAAKKAGREVQRLVGKNIALIFEKTSTRTRCSFEVAAYDQGARVTYLDPSGSQMGHKESVADTARVLGRFYDGIEFRGKEQAHVETLAELSGVPVWNVLTDQRHPTQMLADQLTMIEHSGKPIQQIAFAYLGDARNNVANSLLISAALMGMDVRMVAPTQLQPETEIIDAAHDLAATSGARITITDDPTTGVAGVDFLGRTHQPAAPLPDQPSPGPSHRQPEREIPALPTRLPRPQHHRRPRHLHQNRHGRPGSHRRRLRIPPQRRLRPSRKPHAHHQSRHGRHPRHPHHRGDTSMRIVVALGGNALLERNQTPNASTGACPRSTQPPPEGAGHV